MGEATIWISIRGSTKRSIALAFHRVREMVAAKALYCFHIPSAVNVSDCMTKSLPRRPFWSHVKPVLFWAGDTIECRVSPRVDARLGSVNSDRNSVPTGSSLAMELTFLAMELTILAMELISPGQDANLGTKWTKQKGF